MLLEELFEAIKGGKVDAAMSKIISYLQKSLDGNLIRIPGVEHFKNSKEEGYGIRYNIDGTARCLRFNWASSGSTGKSAALVSVDLWNGSNRNPDFNFASNGVSLAKVLPSLAKQIVNPRKGEQPVFATKAEGQLNEARKDDYDTSAALRDFLKRLEKGQSFTRSEFAGQYHISNVGIFDTVMNGFDSDFDIQGKRVTWLDGADADEIYDKIIGERDGVLQVSSGGTGEQYGETPEEARLEETEHVSFSDSIEHLQGLVEGIVKGSFNALFVAGKGGTGKTQTVEDTLHAAGLKDGAGYFKNTGTASPFGIYEMLYKHRNGIILFDDSDGALSDQDGRNIIKAATDTKKLRKLVWSKKNAKLYDPERGVPKPKGKKAKEVDVDNLDDYNEEGEDTIEEPTDMIPSYFNFEGRIIFISNMQLDKLDPDGALRTRAFVIAINPTNEEIYQRMEEIIDHIKLESGSLTRDERMEVLDIIKSSKKKGDASLRTLVRALNIASSGASQWRVLVRLYA